MKQLLLLFLIGSVLKANVQKDFYTQLSDAALTLTKDAVRYEPKYVKIQYPNGDVPAHTGVCTDVVIRAYRKLGIDLQKEVHEDMKANFAKYPKTWGLKSTDTNIDHRRVPNLQTFFTRKGEKLAVTQKGSDYKPGDIVTRRYCNLDAKRQAASYRHSGKQKRKIRQLYDCTQHRQRTKFRRLPL